MPSIDVVNDLSPRDQYVATANQTDFDYNFPIFEDGDLVVATAPDENSEAEVLALNTDYTVSGEGNDTGGTVVLTTGVSAGTIVTIYRDIPIARNTDVSQNGPWSSTAYNDELDKIVLILQQLKLLLDRTLRLSLTSTADPEITDVDDLAELAGFITTLDSLSDVQVPSPNDQDVLSWDNDLGLWVPIAPGAIQSEPADNVIELRGAYFVSATGSVNASTVNDVPIYVKQAGNISKVVILTRGGTGSCAVDIWKKSFDTYPATIANSIVSGNFPAITAGIKFSDETLTGWNKAVVAGDTLMVHLTSSSTFTVVAVFIQITPVGTLPVDETTDDRIRDIVDQQLDERGLTGVTFEGDIFNMGVSPGSYENLYLFKLAGSPTGAVTVNFTVPAGTTVKATGTRDYAIDTSGFASGSVINLLVEGDVDGRGGDAGDGGSLNQDFGGPDIAYRLSAQNGRDAGHAIKGPGAGRTLNLLGSGRVRGGGGGGAGGGASINNSTGLTAGGGGGGGGAGGGRGARGGRLNIAENESATAGDGTDGSSGYNGTNGSAGAGAQGSGNASGGAGGAGGTWGAVGAAGTYPTAFTRDLAAATGGAAGKAININAGTVDTGDFTGTISGAVS